MSEIDRLLSEANNQPKSAVKFQMATVQKALQDYRIGMRSFSTNPVVVSPKASDIQRGQAVYDRMKEYHIHEWRGGADTDVFKHLDKIILGKKELKKDTNIDAVIKFARPADKVDETHKRVNLERDFMGAFAAVVLGKVLPEYFPQTEVSVEENLLASEGKAPIFVQSFVRGQKMKFKHLYNAPSGTKEYDLNKRLEKVLPQVGLWPHDMHWGNIMQTNEGKLSIIDPSRSNWSQYQDKLRSKDPANLVYGESAKNLYMEAIRKILSPHLKKQLDVYAKEQGYKIRFSGSAPSSTQTDRAVSLQRGKRGGMFYKTETGSKQYKQKGAA